MPSNLLAARIQSLREQTVFRSSAKLYAELSTYENMNPEQLRAVQDKVSSRQVQFAFEHVPFYRDYYSSHGFNRQDLEDPQVFTSLPIVEKHHVRENYEAFISSERTEKNSVVSRTGGSTGKPMHMLRDLRFQARALEWQLFGWWQVPVYGHHAEIRRRVEGLSTSKRRQLLWWPTRRFQANAYRLDEAEIRAFAAKCAQTPPAIIVGYVGAVLEVARKAKEFNITIPTPIAVATTAAPLTGGIREELQDFFGTNVYDHYRSTEVPWMAGECSARQGLHVLQPYRRLEIVDEHNELLPAGQVGQVVASDLSNRVFPLIRYRLGDRTSEISSPCSCGMPFARIAPVSGRISEAIVLPSGVKVPAEGLTTIGEGHIGKIRQFQFHQYKDLSIELRVVLADDPQASEAAQAVREVLSRVLGHEVPVRLKVVDSIEHDGGKIRYITSDAA